MPATSISPILFLPKTGASGFEWRFTDGTDASLEISLETLQSYLHIYNVRTGTEEELELSLKDKAGWAALAERLSPRQQPAP